MAVDTNDNENLNPSFTGADGVNVPINVITSVDALGVSLVVYRRVPINADGSAVYSAASAGNIIGGTFSHYTFGIFTYAPLTAGPDVEFIDQIGTAASVTANYTGATRTTTRTCVLDTSAPNGGLPTGTGVAGRCSNPDNAINGVDTSTETGLARTLSGFTPTLANGGLVTRTIMNDDYEPTVVGPTASISGATSAIRPATISLTSTSTAGDNPIVSEVWTDDSAFIDVNPSTGVVTAFGVFSATITLTVTDSVGNSDTATHPVSFTNPVAPTIFVSPGSRSIAAAGGAGTAFMVSTTGTNVTVTVSGENAGVLVTGLSASADGSWSWSENTGAARNGVIRFTVRDGLNQSDFQEVTVSQAQAVAMATCFTYTFTHGVSGTGPPPNIGSYVLCDGTVQANTSLEDGFSACIQEGTALSAGTGSWSQGTGC